MNKIVKKTLDGIKRYLDETSFLLKEERSEVENLSNLLLENGKCNDLLDAYDFLNQFFDLYCQLSLVEKGYIFSLLQTHNVLMLENSGFTYPSVRLQDVMGYFNLSSSEKAIELYDKYYYHKENLSKDELEKFQAISFANKARQFHLSRYIRLHKLFIAKQVRCEDDYAIVNTMKIIGIPNSLIDAFVAYYRSLDSNYNNEKKSIVEVKPVQKKEEKVVPSVSRTSLKKRLNELVQKEFSYHNYDELLRVLKGLNYPEDKNHEILKNVFEHAKRNHYYYNYILRKVIFENPDNNDLDFILTFMANSNSLEIEDMECFLEEVQSICDENFKNIMKKDDYDRMRMRALKI